MATPLLKLLCNCAASVGVVLPGTLAATGMVNFNQQPGNKLLKAVILNAAGLAVYTTQVGDLFAGNSAITAT